MDIKQIRETFLGFFQKNDHLLIQDASLVPQNDPTLLLINSGMAPIKPYFTGDKTPPHARMCDIQKCVRTNDIEDVGDRHHLTFFHMMGSWSIGDYFKQEALAFATDLLCNGFGLSQEKLYVTVHEGDAAQGLAYDQETYDRWANLGFKPNQIVPLPSEDNFWGPAGDTGPCGPCTEVFIDMGPDAGPSYEDTGHFDTKSRYIEIWNAGVFMQFFKDAEGKFSPLPFKSVDTGSGLERMAIALNGYQSVYETEPYASTIEALPAHLAEKDKRVLADHGRTISHLIADGVFPGRNGREYVVRRLIRRMESIGFRNDFAVPFDMIVDNVMDADSVYYPHLASAKDAILTAVNSESRSFNRVLKNGAKALDKAMRGQEGEVTGKVAFDIVSSVGMPIEALDEVAAQKGFTINRPSYDSLMELHREKSRQKNEPK